VLVVPRSHHADAAALAAAEPGVVADLVAAAARIAAQDGLDGGYRLVLNTGAEGGQSVFHTHLHLLGGRPMGWPPG
jgi:histidine triad (HIT) family protein